MYTSILSIHHKCIHDVCRSVTATIWCCDCRTLLDIADVDGKVLIRVFVTAGVVELQSGAVTSSSPTWRLPDEEWHHLALQVSESNVDNNNNNNYYYYSGGGGVVDVVDDDDDDDDDDEVGVGDYKMFVFVCKMMVTIMMMVVLTVITRCLWL